MNDGEALLKAVLANPAEDTPRLMYADWLDENTGTVPCGCDDGVIDTGGFTPWGDPIHAPCGICDGASVLSDSRAARAEFIRVGVELGRMDRDEYDHTLRRWKVPGADEKSWGLVRRSNELLGLYHEEWERDLPRLSWVPGDEPGDTLSPYRWRRGWVDTVVLRGEDWAEWADTICLLHPITRVEFTSVPLLQLFSRRSGEPLLVDGIRLVGSDKTCGWDELPAGEVVEDPRDLPLELLKRVLAVWWKHVTFTFDRLTVPAGSP